MSINRPENNPEATWSLEIFTYDFKDGNRVTLDVIKNDDIVSLLEYGHTQVDWDTTWFRIVADLNK